MNMQMMDPLDDIVRLGREIVEMQKAEQKQYEIICECIRTNPFWYEIQFSREVRECKPENQRAAIKKVRERLLNKRLGISS